MKLSVVIITKNEGRKIEACLRSLVLIDQDLINPNSLDYEIIVVDDYSTDQTRQIAGGYTKKIFLHSLKTLGEQKQFALEQALGTWILSLDADERVSPELGEEIQELVNKDTDAVGFRIPFLNHFATKPLFFGGEDYKHLRLVKRQFAHFSPYATGESLEALGSIGELSGKILHFSYPSVGEVLGKFIVYAQSDATARFLDGQGFSLKKLLGDPLRVFVRRTIVMKGYLDGKEGIILSLLFCLYAFLQEFNLFLIEIGLKKPVFSKR